MAKKNCTNKILKQLAVFIPTPHNAEDSIPVPAVLHDFGLAPNGDERPQDLFYGLLMLRRNIGIETKKLNETNKLIKKNKLKYKLHFPRFDFACVWYLHQKRRLSKEIWEELFPEEEFELAIQIFDTFTKIPGAELADAVLNLVLERFGKSLYVIWQQRGLKKEDIEEIRDMDLDTKLTFELPRLLAQDLNTAMSQDNSPQRLVLFFDTHETFWGSQRDLGNSSYFQRDEWFRYLLAELEFSYGIVVVVAGREKLRWEDADKYDIPQDYLDVKSVDHFSEADAREYLRRAGISKDVWRDDAINYASVAKDEVHPLLLGLCADVILQGKQGLEKLDINQDLPTDNVNTVIVTQESNLKPFNANFDRKAKQLINRLLKYADTGMTYAIDALSACRGFNYDIYELLGKELKFLTSKPSFDILTGFSFVWEAQEQSQDWYRIHDLLRRLYYEQDNETTQKAHEVLEKYYRDRGEVAEAIYHANRLDWERGVGEWVDEFDQTLKLSRYDRCRVLLEIRNKLVIQNDFELGRVSQTEGDYFAQLSQHQDALTFYTQAIASYDQALLRAPDLIQAHNNKGIALENLGNLQASLSEHQEALTSYTQAIASYDQALLRAPDLIQAHNNKGNALQRLGELQASLSEHQEALTSYTQAIASYDQALERAPDYTYAHLNKGNALQRLGELQASLSEHQEASYTQAIASYDQILHRAPDYTYAHNNKGIALENLGNLQASLSQHQDALTSYTQAIASYDQALERAPDDINGHNNKGLALQNLGNLQASLSQHQDALTSYTQAIASYDQALERAPDDIYAHNNKGLALQNLGKLQASLSQHQQALTSYTQAIASYDQALLRAPDLIQAHNNKGLALQNLGKLQASLSEHQEALTSYTQAIASYDQALHRAPDYINGHNNKGVALQNLGDLQASLSQHQEALTSYTQAIASYDQALHRAPDDINGHNNKGVALQKLGDLQASLSEHQEALTSYTQAIASYDQALHRAPDDINGHNNKGVALQNLGKLQASLSQPEEALKSYQAGLAEVNRSLEISPNDKGARNLRDKLQELLDDLD